MRSEHDLVLIRVAEAVARGEGYVRSRDVRYEQPIQYFGRAGDSYAEHARSQDVEIEFRVVLRDSDVLRAPAPTPPPSHDERLVEAEKKMLEWGAEFDRLLKIREGA